mmetsp:Transcript_1918/g.4038  ORF Transcript_1918/g.4038 Transcript_1918/m.4038 type:complete len:144 (+) Transcript_1918:45-476(+)
MRRQTNGPHDKRMGVDIQLFHSESVVVGGCITASDISASDISMKESVKGRMPASRLAGLAHSFERLASDRCRKTAAGREKEKKRSRELISQLLIRSLTHEVCHDMAVSLSVGLPCIFVFLSSTLSLHLPIYPCTCLLQPESAR